MPGRPLLRDLDRRRRDHGQCLPGPGLDRRAPSARGLFDGLALSDCIRRYKTAVDDGLLKVMSKMGISVISSYRGGCNFEAVGLSRTLVDEYFPAMPSRLSGIGLTGIQQKVLELHERAWAEAYTALPIGGLLPLPARRRAPCLGRQPDPHAAGRGRDRFLFDLQEVQRRRGQAAADLPARPARLQDRGHHGGADRGGRIDHFDPQALRHPGHVTGRARARRPTAPSTSR